MCPENKVLREKNQPKHMYFMTIQVKDIKLFMEEM